MHQVIDSPGADASVASNALGALWDDIRRQVQFALVRTCEPSLFWIGVRVSSEGIILSGMVFTEQHRHTALDIARQCGQGLPIVDRLTVWASTSSRLMS